MDFGIFGGVQPGKGQGMFLGIELVFPKEIIAFIGLSGGRFTRLSKAKSSGRKYLKVL